MFIELIGAGGYAAWGLWYGSKFWKKTTPASKPICGCGHHLAIHDPASKACHTQLFNMDGIVVDKSYRCPCRQYVGPEPIHEFTFTPKILTDMSIGKWVEDKPKKELK